MDNKKKPAGRGHLLDMMRQIEGETLRSRGLSHSVETPSVSSGDQTRSFEGQSSSELQSSIGTTGSNISVGRGRAQLTSLIRSMSSAPPESRGPSAAAVSRGAVGRGSLIAPKFSSYEPTTSKQASTPVQQSDPAGVLGQLSDLSVYDNPSTSDVAPSEETALVSRQGTSGTKIDMFANYIDLKIESGKGLFQYEVKFMPDIDSRGLRRKLLNQHAVKLGRTRTFDGMTLFLPTKLPEDVTIYHSEHPMDGSQVTLQIIYKKRQSMSENIQFFNVLLGRILRALSLVRIGRQSFNPRSAHNIEQHKLEVWPGYVTAINEYEGGLKLCLDAKHRVMRTQTIRDLITDMVNRQRSNYKDHIAREIIGTSVLTRYNNRTYRIDDIAWDKTPKFVFSKSGENITLIDYYKIQWNIEIEDSEQPLLIHRATERTSTGEKHEKIILLVPELSYAAGLTDSIRSNYKIMKDLDSVTKMSPNYRRTMIKKFIDEIKKNEVTREILSGWGLQLNNDIDQFRGRVFDPEVIQFGNNVTFQPKRDRPGDWGAAAVRNHVLRTPNLNEWHIFYIQKDSNYVKEFLDMLFKVVRTIGMQINDPRKIVLRDDRTETYLREIQSSFTNTLELVVIIFPSNRTDRYSAVKKLCCVQKPIASQAIMTKTISNAAKLKSVTEKIALQINCKLGGALWAVNLPMKNAMICGIDVYHTGIGGAAKKSFAGFVASLDAQLTKWHSRICIQNFKQELVDLLQMCLISAINAYHKHNKCYPNRIIIYRDGVGDGDLDYVAKYEIKQLLKTFSRIEPNYAPQLSVIIVQKRINTRLFIKDRDGLGNPSPGTVVDSHVTRRNYYDFFLVPQSVREGTVTPTHYIVVHDTSNLETDHMQRLTYKLCHLYYNWPGTIRVPAPCQYAHKLVYQIGQNIQAEPDKSLSNILFYL